MQNVIRVIAMAMFATAGFSWWHNGQLPKTNRADQSVEDIQASLAELLPDVDFETEMAARAEDSSRLLVDYGSDAPIAFGDEAPISFGESDDGLGDAPAFDAGSENVNLDSTEPSGSKNGPPSPISGTETVALGDDVDNVNIVEVAQTEVRKDVAQEAVDDIEAGTTSVDDVFAKAFEEPTGAMPASESSEADASDAPLFNPSDSSVEMGEAAIDDADAVVMFGQSSDGSAVIEPADDDAAESFNNNVVAPHANPKKNGHSAIVPVTSNRQAVVKWDRKYSTTGRRPFETQTLGTGPNKVMVIGSLYGTEPSSALMMDRLLHNLSRNIADYEDTTFLLVRTGNPDGRSYQVAGNLRGVLLDRNFFAPSKVTQVGTAPTRPELETLTLMKLINDFGPQRVIQLRTVKGNTGKIEFTSQDEAIAGLFEDFGVYTIESSSDRLAKGSLASYVSNDMKRRAVTVTMPVSGDVNKSWMQNRGSLLRVLRELKPPHHDIPGRPGSEIDLREGPIAEGVSASEDRVVPFGESRAFEDNDPTHPVPEVEFLPPPPHAKNRRRGMDSAVVEELPPPPDRN